MTVSAWISRTTTSSALASEAASARIRASIVGSITARPPPCPPRGRLSLRLKYSGFNVYVQYPHASLFAVCIRGQGRNGRFARTARAGDGMVGYHRRVMGLEGFE